MIDEEGPDMLLIARWRSGSRVAADQLLRRYTPLLRGFFARRISSNVDELVQRTLLACLQGMANFEGRSSFRTYVFGIAQNQLLMSQRSEARWTHTSEQQARTPAEDSPSQLLAVKEEQRLLLAALFSVGPEFRSVLKKFYWDGQSVEEIAEELGAPLGTIKSRLSRGRASLKACVRTLRKSKA